MNKNIVVPTVMAAVMRGFSAEAYPLEGFVVFNLVAYSFLFLGTFVIYKHIRPLMMIPLFFVSCGMLGNALWHPIFSIVAKGYFPGLYTALLYWILAPMTIARIWRETR